MFKRSKLNLHESHSIEAKVNEQTVEVVKETVNQVETYNEAPERTRVGAYYDLGLRTRPGFLNESCEEGCECEPCKAAADKKAKSKKDAQYAQALSNARKLPKKKKHKT